jgi:hypothetical protein
MTAPDRVNPCLTTTDHDGDLDSHKLHGAREQRTTLGTLELEHAGIVVDRWHASPARLSHLLTMPRSLHARRRHSQRAKRRAGVFVGMTSYPAPWWHELVAQVQQIVEESGVVDGFDAESWVLDFVRAPAPALGGRTPLSFMETEAGVAQVKQLVWQMQSGAYA